MAARTIGLMVEVTLTPIQIARALWGMNDEEQAQTIIELAKIARADTDACGWDFQWIKVGEHLASCTCSSDDARDIIDTIHHGLHGTGGLASRRV